MKIAKGVVSELVLYSIDFFVNAERAKSTIKSNSTTKIKICFGVLKKLAVPV